VQQGQKIEERNEGETAFLADTLISHNQILF